MTKVALITGGASGIGKALAHNLARRGYVVALADRQHEAAAEVAEEVRGRGGRAEVYELDVRDRAAFADVARRLKQEQGSIDMLFNNAGIGVGAPVAEHTSDDWDHVLDVNLRGVVHGIEAVYPIMIEQGSGHIVNPPSVAGLLAIPGEGSYAASKHAVVGLSKTLRIEAAEHGVRVSVFCPGPIRTPILTGGKFGRIEIAGLSKDDLAALWERLRPMNPDTFAEKSLRKVFANEFVIIEPSWWKLAWYVERIAPNFGLWLSSRFFDRITRG